MPLIPAEQNKIYWMQDIKQNVFGHKEDFLDPCVVTFLAGKACLLPGPPGLV